MVCDRNVKVRILPALDRVRVKMDTMGLRKYTVFMRVTTYSGEQLGDGEATITDIPIQLGGPDGYGFGGTHRVLVRQLQKTSQEVTASHNLYKAGDFMIGPLTPAYMKCPNDTLGGVAPDYFVPEVNAQPTEVKFNISGDGMISGGSWFKLIDQNVSRNFEYYFIVRAIATSPQSAG